MAGRAKSRPHFSGLVIRVPSRQPVTVAKIQLAWEGSAILCKMRELPFPDEASG